MAITINLKSGKSVTTPEASHQNIIPSATYNIPVKTAPTKQQVVSPWSTVQTAYNMSQPGIGTQISKTLSATEKQKIKAGTEKWMKEAPLQAGFMQGVSLNNPLSTLSKKIETPINAPTSDNWYKAGQIGGTIAQFAIPYGGAAKGVGAVTKAVLPNLGKFGTKVAQSVATDLAVGLPLNINYAFGKEGLTGKEAAKSIAFNTGLDLISGGLLEGLGYAIKLKNGKAIASKADFDVLTPKEKEEVLLLLPAPKTEAKMIEEGKVVADGQILNQTFNPITRDSFMGELATRIGNIKSGAWNKYTKANMDTAKEIEAEMSRVNKLSDVEWLEYARQNNLGKYGTDFNTPVKAEPQVDPLIFKTQLEPSQIPPQGSTIVSDGVLPKVEPIVPKQEISGLKKDLGADIYKGDKTTEQLVKEFGAIPKGEIPFRDVSVPKKTDYGDVQQFTRTMAESEVVDDTLLKDIEDSITSFTKSTKSNATAVDDASKTIADEGIDNAFTKFKSVILSDKQATSYDIALGSRLLQELQKSGRYNDALDTAIDLSQMLSETGRTLQASRILKRLTPEGRLKVVAKLSEKISQKTGKQVKISEDTIKKISIAKTEKEITQANQKAAIELWNQTPANFIDKLNSWRYTAMLFNPKTHVRNIVGNSLFVPVREFKNLIGTGLEKAIIREGEKTKAVLNPVKDKEIMNFANKDFDNVVDILKGEGKIDDVTRDIQAKVFKTKAFEKIRELNLNVMNAEDTWFMKFAYDGSLAQYMKANKLKPSDMVGTTLEKARKYAMDEALKATYRDANSLARAISKTKSKLAEGKSDTLLGSIGKKAGGIALEGAVPFAKTPLNIIKRGIGYSPANIVRGLSNLYSSVKKGQSPTEAIDQLASGLSGSSLLALGTYLGYNGIVQGKETDFKDKSYNYNQMVGSQNYALNIDGDTYTLDWAAPLSMPFFVGVELSNMAKDKGLNLANVLDAMSQVSDPMVNLSMLKGINQLLTNNYEGISQTALDLGSGYLGQYNPTLFGQIARTADKTRRETTSTSETSLGRQLEKFGKKQVAKIPVASKSLEPYVDLWGREEKTGNIVENFLSPGYFKSKNLTNVDNEIAGLKSELDEEQYNSIVPRSTSQYVVTADKVPYRMDESQLTRFKKTRGQTSFNMLSNLFGTSKYQSATTEEKVKQIKSVYDDAFETAKKEFLQNKGVKYDY